MMKTCTRCNTAYPATGEFFPRTKQIKSGLLSYCKSCHAQRLREWQRQNRDKVKAYKENARAKDPERVKQYSRNYHRRQRAKMEKVQQLLAEKDRRITELEAQLRELRAAQKQVQP